MKRHDDPAIQAVYERWYDAVLQQADHRISCRSGCSILGDTCATGLGNAAAAHEAWVTYYHVRIAAGVEVATG